MFFDSVLHRYFSLANVDLTAFTGNPLNPPSCLAGSTAFFGLTRYDLKKSPTWKQRVCFVVLGSGCCSSFSEVWVRWKNKNFDVANFRLEYKFCSLKASGKWLSTLEKFYLKFPLCITNLERSWDRPLCCLFAPSPSAECLCSTSWIFLISGRIIKFFFISGVENRNCVLKCANIDEKNCRKKCK